MSFKLSNQDEDIVTHVHKKSPSIKKLEVIGTLSEISDLLHILSQAHGIEQYNVIIYPKEKE